MKRFTTAHAHTTDFLENPVVAFCSVAVAWTVVSAILHPLPTEFVKIKYSIKSKYAGERGSDDSSKKVLRQSQINRLHPLCAMKFTPVALHVSSPDLMTLPLSLQHSRRFCAASACTRSRISTLALYWL